MHVHSEKMKKKEAWGGGGAAIGKEKESLHRHLVKQNTSSLSSFVSRDSLFLFLNK
jgi:hypothetical protein